MCSLSVCQKCVCLESVCLAALGLLSLVMNELGTEQEVRLFICMEQERETC